MKTEKIKLFCKKGGETYTEEIEGDETEVKFWCPKHHVRLYKIKDEARNNN